MSQLWCEWAWLGGAHVESGVVIDIDGDQIASVTAHVATCPGGSERRPGVTIPGFVNAHSHVFHRALRARTQGGKGSFWTWRDQMYELAALLDPDTLHALARATYGEMSLAGITTVEEFHYVHHDTGGHHYDDPNAMSHAVISAARDVGLRIVLVDACYLEGGIGRSLEGVQLRFGDGSVHAWADRVDALDAGGDVQVAAAIHSARAVSPTDMKEIARWAHERSAPLHAHVSEQRAENRACIDAYGATPTQLLQDAGAFGADFTAVHAIHLDGSDVALLGSARVCLCPTTERDLADGIAPSGQLRDAGARLAVGSDSNAVVDMFEEARGIELDTRLATGERGIHPAVELLGAATGGATLEAGAKADLVTIGVSSPRLAGAPAEALLDALTFAATADDVTAVMVAGKEVVRDGAHVSIDVATELDRAVRTAWRER
jgi:formiminoglutamate deiminase